MKVLSTQAAKALTATKELLERTPAGMWWDDIAVRVRQVALLSARHQEEVLEVLREQRSVSVKDRPEGPFLQANTYVGHGYLSPRRTPFTERPERDNDNSAEIERRNESIAAVTEESMEELLANPHGLALGDLLRRVKDFRALHYHDKNAVLANLTARGVLIHTAKRDTGDDLSIYHHPKHPPVQMSALEIVQAKIKTVKGELAALLNEEARLIQAELES